MYSFNERKSCDKSYEDDIINDTYSLYISKMFNFSTNFLTIFITIQNKLLKYKMIVYLIPTVMNLIYKTTLFIRIYTMKMTLMSLL